MVYSRPGDLWVAGPHRVMCGDCTDHGNIRRLMNNAQAAACVTSPPYLSQRTYITGIPNWDRLMQGAFSGLPLENSGQVLVNLGPVHRDGEFVEYWTDWLRWMRSDGWRFFGQYVWDKTYGLPGNWSGRLAPAHEYVFHFNKVAKQPHKTVPKQPESIQDRNCKTGLRNKDDTRQHRAGDPATFQHTHKIPDSVLRINRDSGRSGHPAAFPPVLPRALIEAYTNAGDVIYEPFLGSGSTLIAAHQSGRRCCGIELQPTYCDIILGRIVQECRIVPYRAYDGMPFGADDWFQVAGTVNRQPAVYNDIRLAA